MLQRQGTGRTCFEVRSEIGASARFVLRDSEYDCEISRRPLQSGLISRPRSIKSRETQIWILARSSQRKSAWDDLMSCQIKVLLDLPYSVPSQHCDSIQLASRPHKILAPSAQSQDRNTNALAALLPLLINCGTMIIPACSRSCSGHKTASFRTWPVFFSPDKPHTSSSHRSVQRSKSKAAQGQKDPPRDDSRRCKWLARKLGKARVRGQGTSVSIRVVV